MKLSEIEGVSSVSPTAMYVDIHKRILELEVRIRVGKDRIWIFTIHSPPSSSFYLHLVNLSKVESKYVFILIYVLRDAARWSRMRVELRCAQASRRAHACVRCNSDVELNV